MAFMYFAYLP